MSGHGDDRLKVIGVRGRGAPDVAYLLRTVNSDVANFSHEKQPKSADSAKPATSSGQNQPPSDLSGRFAPPDPVVTPELPDGQYRCVVIDPAPSGVHIGRVYEPWRGYLSPELLVASIAARGGWVPLEDEPLDPAVKREVEASAEALLANGAGVVVKGENPALSGENVGETHSDHGG